MLHGSAEPQRVIWITIAEKRPSAWVDQFCITNATQLNQTKIPTINAF